MIMTPLFEIVCVAGEYMAIPVGEYSKDFSGIVVLSEAAAFLLNHMKSPKSEEELVDILLEEYDVERSIALKDIRRLIDSLFELGLIDK